MLTCLPPLEEVYNMAGLSLPKIVAPRKVDEKDGQGSAGADVAEQADVKADSAAETAEGANSGTKSGAEGANPQKDNK